MSTTAVGCLLNTCLNSIFYLENIFFICYINIIMKHKYIYVKNLLNKDMCDFVTNWLFKKMEHLPADPQSINSPAIHSNKDNVMQALLYFIKPKIEKATGLKLKPTYAYSRIYREGADLKPHKDRQACEISCSLTLNYNYKDKKYYWPLYMESKPINIKKGDGVIYKGMEITHSRKKFKEKKSSWHHQIFLHYVNIDGNYSNTPEENIYSL